MTETTTSKGAFGDLATHLAGIQRALLSVAKALESQVDADTSATVQSQLEWAASHIYEAVLELTGPGDLTGGTLMPSPVRRALPEQSSDLRQGLKGHSQAVAIPEILGFVSSLRKNGVLRINSRDECFLIQLELGKVVYAQGDNPPQGQLLGEVLVSQGAITREALDKALARESNDPERLGQSLLTEGLVTKDALCIALAFQVQLMFHRMYVSEDSVFQFDEGLEIMQPGDIRLNVTSLLLESARSQDEQARDSEAGLSSQSPPAPLPS